MDIATVIIYGYQHGYRVGIRLCKHRAKAVIPLSSKAMIAVKRYAKEILSPVAGKGANEAASSLPVNGRVKCQDGSPIKLAGCGHGKSSPGSPPSQSTGKNGKFGLRGFSGGLIGLSLIHI